MKMLYTAVIGIIFQWRVTYLKDLNSVALQDMVGVIMKDQQKSLDVLNKQIVALNKYNAEMKQQAQLEKATAGSLTDPNSVHMAIRYPGFEEPEEEKEEEPEEVKEYKTPLVLVSVQPALSLDRLYEKLVEGAIDGEGDALRYLKASNGDKNIAEKQKALKKTMQNLTARIAYYRADQDAIRKKNEYEELYRTGE